MVKDHTSKGGIARSEVVPAERRIEIARQGGKARWAELPYATHDGELKLGDAIIPSAVLNDKRRVLTQSGVMRALGRARQAKGRSYYDGDVNLPAFLTAKNLKPFISEELERSSTPLIYLPRNPTWRIWPAKFSCSCLFSSILPPSSA